MTKKIEKDLDRIVRERARGLCEYCLMPQAVRRLQFPIDHILPRQHGGTASSANLVLCCVQIVGITPTGRATVYVLAINHPDDLAIRDELLLSGRFPANQT